MPLVKREELDSFVGKEAGVSDWLEITQERVNQFADATGDHQFIHVDPEKAAKTPFGGPIAHGFLTLSLLPYFAGQGHTVRPENVVMGINYGLDKVRFLTPVKVGAKLRGRYTFTGYEEKGPGRILLKHTVVMEIEGEDKPAMIADSLAMVVLSE